MLSIESIIFSFVALICGVITLYWLLQLKKSLSNTAHQSYIFATFVAISFLLSFPLWNLFITMFSFASESVQRVSYLFFSVGYFGVLMVVNLSMKGVSDLKVKSTKIEKKYKSQLKTLKKINLNNQKLTTARGDLKDNIKILKSLNKKRDEFLSMVSHELQSPVASISGFIQLLQDPELRRNKPKLKKYTKILNTEVDRLGRLIKDMLDLSKLDLKSLKLEYSSVDIKKILYLIKKSTKIRLKKKRLSLKFDIKKAPSEFESDNLRFTQVLNNLVNNAINYTKKGTIIIKAFKEGKTVHFVVIDNGPGIPKEYLNKVFNKFERLNVKNTKILGSGLGLPICKSLIDAMNGNIWVESKLGKGSQFHFTLPIKRKK